MERESTIDPKKKEECVFFRQRGNWMGSGGVSNIILLSWYGRYGDANNISSCNEIGAKNAVCEKRYRIMIRHEMQ